MVSESKSLQLCMLELDPDGSGVVSRDEFSTWYTGQLKSLMESPFDLMYGTTHSHAFWWSSQVLWVKFLVNLVFTFGYFKLPDSWHFYISCIVATSLFLLVNQHPYVNSIDHQVELLALLCLGGLAHIAAIFRAGETWSSGFMVIAFVLFAIPFLAIAILTAAERNRMQRDAEERQIELGFAAKTQASGGCCTRVKQRNYDVETLSVPADETHLAGQATVAIDMHRPGASSFANPSVLPVAPAASGVKVQP